MRLFHAVYAFNAAGWWVVIAMLAVTLCIFIQFRWAFFRLNRAWFIVGHFTKTNRSNVLQFTVMTSMSYHFVGVWTNEITFQTMKMWWLIVCACWKKPKKNMKLVKSTNMRKMRIKSTNHRNPLNFQKSTKKLWISKRKNLPKLFLYTQSSWPQLILARYCLKSSPINLSRRSWRAVCCTKRVLSQKL